MRYLSVCSGIEAATVAWHGMGWQPEAFSEIEKFPSAVLAHHYPHVRNLGDMTNYKEWSVGDIDLLVGGTPCQSFSVAGLRKGLADPRGNLCLVYLGIAERFHPRWILWENVPGVLSSGRGRDFGSFLGALAELGYGWSYRILDAQYFGVPQRRRRVFVVGYLGDWRRAAAVLFERHSLSGNPPPSREKGEGTSKDVARSLTRRYDSSEDGTGRGLELVPCFTPSSHACNRRGTGSLRSSGGDLGGGSENLLCMAPGQGGAEIRSDGSPSLTCNHEAPIVFDTTNITSRQNGSNPKTGDPCFTLAKGQHPPLMVNSEVCPTLGKESVSPTKSSSGQMVDFCILQKSTVAGFLPGQGSKAKGIGYEEETAPTPQSGCDSYGVHQQIQVRRLTPVECERLQGFPDNYTNIPWRKKSESPDGPRYKALGNSMAVPCMRWLGERIQEVDRV